MIQSIYTLAKGNTAKKVPTERSPKILLRQSENNKITELIPRKGIKNITIIEKVARRLSARIEKIIGRTELNIQKVPAI